MRSVQNIKGWMTALAVIGTVSAVLPVMGAQASHQRNLAKWSQTAAAFHIAELPTVDFLDPSMPRLRDAADIRSLSPVRAEHRRWAKTRASEVETLSQHDLRCCLSGRASSFCLPIFICLRWVNGHRAKRSGVATLARYCTVVANGVCAGFDEELDALSYGRSQSGLGGDARI